MADTEILLAAYDGQMRGAPPTPPTGVTYEQDGPLLRIVGGFRGLVSGPRSLGVRGAGLDRLIARQRDFFAARGEAVEWKIPGHDEPADLADRLSTAGFVPEPRETVLIGRVAAAPDEISVHVAEADGEVVSAAWLVFRAGTGFASLWGGSTSAEWRGRGIYRALVATRAALAVARGVTYLHVDASDDSAPILRRLGFEGVTTTTPYIWSPEGG
ncbi:MAG: GNAT family N-acetyltransferase [Streptomyces sp.]|nr:GNAT family N-acetyltransferase [Streptomyces sp.]